ncbi:hypothetical protein, partial [Xanthomonas vesicatoria]|uniref:hypothetical protein n=1 Tax=Xanthomonas vesicatoria TaxID=56460 RepID=UPI001C12BBC0
VLRQLQAEQTSVMLCDGERARIGLMQFRNLTRIQAVGAWRRRTCGLCRCISHRACHTVDAEQNRSEQAHHAHPWQ